MASLLQTIPFFFLLVTTVVVILSRKKQGQDKKTGGRGNMPPAPGWKLPVIGHLHCFLTTRGQLPHRLLRDLARKHGDVMRLDLGELQHVVVSSAEAAKEVMRTHDIKFAQRPRHPHQAKVMYDDVDLIYAPYGEYWRQLRRIATLELLTAKRVDSLRRVREAEVLSLVRYIGEQPTAAAVDLTKLLFDLTYRIISMATFGDVSTEQEEFIKVAEEVVEHAGGFKIAVLFPSSGLVQTLFGTEKLLQRLHDGMDGLGESMIRQRRAGRRKAQGTKSAATATAKKEDENLLDVLLNLQEDESTIGFRLSNDAVKALIVDIFLAGSETPSALIEWTMSEMMRNPEVMRKAQAEVRGVFGEKGKVEEARISELTYLKLVIKETLRLHTPAPLALPRECREEYDCQIGGYDIPSKMRVLVNVWAIARDPRYWGEDAEKFVPERFLDNKVGFGGTDFEFLPFGAGRRMCPGMTFGLAAVELPLASLLFHFDWKLPRGVEPASFDMDEQFGVTLRRKNHLELVPVERYSPLLYV